MWACKLESFIGWFSHVRRVVSVDRNWWSWTRVAPLTHLQHHATPIHIYIYIIYCIYLDIQYSYLHRCIYVHTTNICLFSTCITYSKWFLWKAPDFFRSRDALVALCCIEMLGLGNWQMGLGEDGIGGNAEEGCQEDIHAISTHLHLTCQAISFIFSVLVSTSRIYEYIYICT